MMTKEKIGLVVILGAATSAMASPVTPIFGGIGLETDIDIATELIAPASYEHANDQEQDLDLSGLSPVKDPPTSLPSLRPPEPVFGSNPFATLFGSSVSSQPVDTFFSIGDTPGTTVIAIPLPAGAGLATAGVGLLALRRRR